jgi:hypothetical protein
MSELKIIFVDGIPCIVVSPGTFMNKKPSKKFRYILKNQKIDINFLKNNREDIRIKMIKVKLNKMLLEFFLINIFSYFFRFNTFQIIKEQLFFKDVLSELKVKIKKID